MHTLTLNIHGLSTSSTIQKVSIRSQKKSFKNNNLRICSSVAPKCPSEGRDQLPESMHPDTDLQLQLPTIQFLCPHRGCSGRFLKQVRKSVGLAHVNQESDTRCVLPSMLQTRRKSAIIFLVNMLGGLHTCFSFSRSPILSPTSCLVAPSIPHVSSIDFRCDGCRITSQSSASRSISSLSV